MIKAEWTNKDALDLQPTCDQLTTDCIRRQGAIDAVEHITSSMSICLNEDECHGMKRMQRQVILELANMPPAEPERKTGKWYIDAGGNVRCAVCKTKCLRDDIGVNILSNYCPSCGVRMKGDQ